VFFIRHLIADHLSWFTENASDPKTIEEIIEAKGGKVRRGVNYVDGNGYETMEIYDDDKKGKDS
jgi:protein import protein ZIM17